MKIGGGAVIFPVKATCGNVPRRLTRECCETTTAFCAIDASDPLIRQMSAIFWVFCREQVVWGLVYVSIMASHIRLHGYYCSAMCLTPTKTLGHIPT